MNKRITFTPSAETQRFLRKYMKNHEVDKSQGVLLAGLELLEKNELLQAHNRAIRKNQVELRDSRVEVEPGEEERTSEPDELETETRPELVSVPSSLEEEV